jgi:hypothetical protein
LTARPRRAYAAISLVGILCLPLAYTALFSNFALYDDEGFVLVDLYGYLAGRSLYDEIFAQYGPFLYESFGLLFRLSGAPPTHDAARLITLGIWGITAVLGGTVTFRLTGRASLAIAAQVLCFVTLLALASEPLAPPGLVALLLMGVLTVSTFRSARTKGTMMLLLGALVAALTLVKVNVGAFALISVIYAFVLTDAEGFRGAVVQRIVTVLFLITPVVLMREALDRSWAIVFCLFVTLSATAIAVTAEGRARPTPRATLGVAWWIGGVLATTGILLGVTVLQGTSLGGLIDGVVVRPLRVPGVYAVPLKVSWAHVVPAVLSFVGAVLFARSGRSLPPRAKGVVLTLAGSAMWLSIPGGPGAGVTSFWLGLPLAWLALTRSTELQFVRTLLVTLAVMQGLHAFPVAGTQVVLSALLLIPLGAVLISDGAAQLALSVPKPRPLAWIGAALLVAVLGTGLVQRFDEPVRRFRAGQALRLYGATRLRLDGQTAASLRGITRELRARCSTFISLPGLNSFHVFARQRPATWKNLSAWMYVFDRELQASIVEEVQGRADLCAVRSEPILFYSWQQGRPRPTGPLVSFIDEHFEPAVTIGPYEVMVRRADR